MLKYPSVSPLDRNQVLREVAEMREHFGETATFYELPRSGRKVRSIEGGEDRPGIVDKNINAS
jgi:hypothetical protein